MTELPEKKPYLVDDEFLRVFYSAAIDFGTDMVREGQLTTVDKAYEFLKWLYEKADVKPLEQEEYWIVVNKNYDTASSSLKRTYGNKPEI